MSEETGLLVFSQCLGSHTWKQSFLKQTKQDYWVALAQEEDYSHRSNGNLMLLGPMASLSGNCHIKGGLERSVACTVSSKHVLDACGMREGKPITTPLRTLEQPSWQSPWQGTQVFRQQPTPTCSHVSQPSWKVVFSPSHYCIPSQHGCYLMRKPTIEPLQELTPGLWTNRCHVR